MVNFFQALLEAISI